tara:strand:- start:235 stop:717 length:483 start_codon:yes stop_codon:yes gene_type:complete
MATKYTVIKDTREQEGWFFTQTTACDGMVREKLDTGDYSLRGYEELLAIERKGKISEFARNIVENRFERELERLEDFDYPFMLLEFDMKDVLDYPRSSKLPNSKRRLTKVTGGFILKRIIEFQIRYKTKILLCGEEGWKVALSIFKRVVENESKKHREDS